MSNATAEPKFKWAYPLEWLEEHIQTMLSEGNVEELAAIASSLAKELDSDQIQDMFQSEMDTDGYFEDLNAPKIITISVITHDIGYGSEEMILTGHFTGEIDSVGKSTFATVNRTAAYYLFADEWEEL